LGLLIEVTDDRLADRARWIGFGASFVEARMPRCEVPNSLQLLREMRSLFLRGTRTCLIRINVTQKYHFSTH